MKVNGIEFDEKELCLVDTYEKSALDNIGIYRLQYIFSQYKKADTNEQKYDQIKLLASHMERIYKKSNSNDNEFIKFLEKTYFSNNKINELRKLTNKIRHDEDKLYNEMDNYLLHILAKILIIKTNNELFEKFKQNIESNIDDKM